MKYWQWQIRSTAIRKLRNQLPTETHVTGMPKALCIFVEAGGRLMGKPVFQALRGHRPSPRMRASLEEARSEGGTWLFSTQALGELSSGKGCGSLVLSTVQTCGLSRHHWHTKPKEGTRQYCRLRLDVPASSWSKAGFHPCPRWHRAGHCHAHRRQRPQCC